MTRGARWALVVAALASAGCGDKENPSDAPPSTPTTSAKPKKPKLNPGDARKALDEVFTTPPQALAAVNDLERGAGGRGAVHRLTAASLLHAAEACSRIASDAVQIHGGSGYMWEMEVNRLYRATKLIEIGAGTSEVRRLIIAEELLRGA